MLVLPMIALVTWLSSVTMQVGLKYGLPLLSPVDDAGVFTSEAGPFKGLQVTIPSARAT